jgi:predicted RNase H-like HicB family nuclease
VKLGGRKVEFEVYSDGEWWCSHGIGVDIFTQGKTIQDLLNNIREAVQLHFEGGPGNEG